VRPGSQVEAGTDNLQAALTIEATAVGDDTRLAALRDAVADAATTRTPIVQLANRIGGWFVSVVLLLAAGTAAVWYWIDPQQVVGNSVALLIVACPCALALATPLAIAVAIGRLAKRRVLIRAGDCLERLSRPGTIFFDKTGTLTEGSMSVTHWFGDETVLPAVAAIESGVRHPIASAIVARANGSTEAVKATDVRQLPGLGVIGTVNGTQYVVGNSIFVSDNVAGISSSWLSDADHIARAGASPVWIAKNDEIVAVCGISDPLREDAAMVVSYFAKHGWEVGILSGDDARTVDEVGHLLGLKGPQCHGGLLPVQKLAAIHSANRSPVVMVGDGVNDAAALAAADVGVAIRGGASASLTAAPVMIGDGKLSQVTALVQAADSTRRSIRRNFAISIGYNVFAVGLAMTGAITPLIAAVLMPISSISVIAMTLADRTFKEST
jgi:Cu2+-exporting ATPase